MAKEIINNSGMSYNSLSSGSKIIGKIEADSDFRIDGSVDGEITCKGKVVIGASGSLLGTISCANAEIFGKVEGDIIASDTLSLRGTAKIKGTIKTKVLVIEPNAVFNGSCSMSDESPAAKKLAQ
ncbi:MAG: polymer-forming cytoskeletal protein [Paludibacter sp.]|jgi:cytoskeletal protein CcmA (bactofilin family)|nr:polymer-forming cytoskeletal protein [Paludibacter sp.]